VTIGEALRAAARELADAGVPSPRVDAELLVAHATGATRTGLYTDGRRELAADELDRLEAQLARRRRREPLAYVLGEWGFRRLTLKTDARALVPRPETEILVERCLALLADLGDAPRVLDVGVGSGAIALAIADEHPCADVTAIDTSADALALARENVRRTGFAVELRAGGFEVAAEGWDLVVSNPPYVRPDEIDRLEPEVRDWEPRAALVGTGLHEELARVARTRALVLEVADDEARGVAASLEAAGYEAVRITPDLAGRERVVEGRRR
jgi:release factor glutamine methyltransferase